MANAEAGPSRSRYVAKAELAPVHLIPTVSLLSVEYPGYIHPHDPASLQRAISTLGGQLKIDQVVSTADTSTLEVNYGRTTDDKHGESRWRHGLLGTTVSGDKLVLRIRKRHKVRVEVDQHGNKTRTRLDHGEFTTEVLGPVSKIVRFRAIADYQYRPVVEGPTAEITNALVDLNHKVLSKAVFPTTDDCYNIRVPDKSAMDVDRKSDDDDEEGEDFSNTKLVSVSNIFPPPRFTMQAIPTKYHFKGNTMSVLTTNALDEDRFVHKNRDRGVPFAMVFMDSTDPVPMESPNKTAIAKVNQPLLERVRRHFQDPDTEEGIQSRPIWSKIALGNMFKESENAISALLKPILPHVAYCFHDGPYRETLVRMGYDPRLDPQARIYQPAQLRIVGKRGVGSRTLAHRTRMPKALNLLPGGDESKFHIFDGIILHKEFSNFQLCDITEPQLAEMIRDPENVSDEFADESGWFRPSRLRLIKRLLRAKFIHLREHYRPLPSEQADAIIAEVLLEEEIEANGGVVPEEYQEKEAEEEREKREKKERERKPKPPPKAKKSRRKMGGKLKGALEEEKYAARLRMDIDRGVV